MFFLAGMANDEFQEFSVSNEEVSNVETSRGRGILDCFVSRLKAMLGLEDADFGAGLVLGVAHGGEDVAVRMWW